jgi:spore coat polysaccharide biosynthesis protein SpsF
MKVIAMVQARMGSSRLPGKVLMPLIKKPLLEILLERLSFSETLDQTIVATTTSPQDDVLSEWLLQKNTPVFRGSEHDVLDRFYNCALEHDAEIIVRITADDPFKDFVTIDRAVKELLDDPLLDYCSNNLIPTFPEGLDVEVFRFSGLREAYNNASLVSEREHVTPYIWKNDDTFKLKNIEHTQNLSHWRLTIDTDVDLALVREIMGYFGEGHIFTLAELTKFLNAHDHLQKMNCQYPRNAGYLRSLEKETKFEK